jgi:hypothetical protein
MLINDIIKMCVYAITQQWIYLRHFLNVTQQYPPITVRQWLCKHIPMAMKNCWRHCFLCGLCCIKGNYAVGSSHNFLINNAICSSDYIVKWYCIVLYFFIFHKSKYRQHHRIWNKSSKVYKKYIKIYGSFY